MNDSESLDIECPRCHQRLRVPADRAGKQIWCPDCDAAIEVPGATGIAAEPSWARSQGSKRDPDRDAALGHDDRDDDPDERPLRRRSSGGAGVIAPAICMILVAAIGLLANLYGLVIGLGGPTPAADPQGPAFLQQMMKDAQTPLAAGVQGFCALMSCLTILGSVQMIRSKTWGLGLTAAILSMINFGNCCCLMGLPFGIWAMVALLNPEVKETFS